MTKTAQLEVRSGGVSRPYRRAVVPSADEDVERSAVLADRPVPRGLHSSTFLCNLSTFGAIHVVV